MHACFLRQPAVHCCAACPGLPCLGGVSCKDAAGELVRAPPLWCGWLSDAALLHKCLHHADIGSVSSPAPLSTLACPHTFRPADPGGELPFSAVNPLVAVALVPPVTGHERALQLQGARRPSAVHARQQQQQRRPGGSSSNRQVRAHGVQRSAPAIEQPGLPRLPLPHARLLLLCFPPCCISSCCTRCPALLPFLPPNLTAPLLEHPM